MSRNRFVRPETVRLELSDGDWIDAKKALTYGESKRLESVMMPKSIKAGQLEKLANGKGKAEDFEIELDFTKLSVDQMLTWLVDWSFTNEAGKREPITRDAILALDPESAAEIEAALDRHIEKKAISV